MSFISSLETFGKDFPSEFRHLFGKAPAFESAAISFITIASPEIEAIIAIFDPAAAAIATPIINKIESALAATQLVLKNGGSAPTVMSLLTSVQGQLSNLLPALQVKDPLTQAKVTGVVNSLTAGVQGVINLIQQSVPTPAPAPVTVTPASVAPVAPKTT